MLKHTHKGHLQNNTCVNRESGAALVETASIALVMMTFMVGIPVIGKIIDVRQTAIQASRYAAWEMTVQSDPRNQPPSQVDIRFFRDIGAPISHGTPDVESNQLWGEKREEERPPPPSELVDTILTDDSEDTPTESLFDKNRVLVTNTAVTTRSAVEMDLGEGPLGVAKPIGKMVHEVTDFIGKDGWKDVEKNGLLQSEVRVNIEGGDMFPATTVTENTSILVDGWSAASEDQIRDRVHGFVPTARLDSIGRFAYKMGKALPMLKDLKGLRRALGCVNTAVLPPKELGNGGNVVLPQYDPSTEDQC